MIPVTYPRTREALKSAQEHVDRIIPPPAYPEPAFAYQGPSARSEAPNVYVFPSGGTHVHNHYPSGRNEENEKKESHLAWIAIPAALVALAASYFVGKSYGQWSEANRRINVMNDQEMFVSAELYYTSPRFQNLVAEIFLLEKKILVHEKNEARSDLIVKTAFIASAILTVVGILASSWALVAVGGTGMLLSVVAMAFRYGNPPYSTSLEQELAAVGRKVNSALETMNRI